MIQASAKAKRENSVPQQISHRHKVYPLINVIFYTHRVTHKKEKMKLTFTNLNYRIEVHGNQTLLDLVQTEPRKLYIKLK